jgi:hypothetical protein
MPLAMIRQRAPSFEMGMFVQQLEHINRYRSHPTVILSEAPARARSVRILGHAVSNWPGWALVLSKIPRLRSE